jgi:hypothetical protein
VVNLDSRVIPTFYYIQAIKQVQDNTRKGMGYKLYTEAGFV